VRLAENHIQHQEYTLQINYNPLNKKEVLIILYLKFLIEISGSLEKGLSPPEF